MKKILITGATGFIGSNFVEANYTDNQLIILHRKNSNITRFKEYKNCFFCEYDETLESLNKINEIAKPDVVLHLATYFVPTHEPNDVDLLVSANLMFSMHLAEFCKSANVKNFIFAGTIWQHYLNQSYNPLSLYAATKQAFADILKFYSEVHGFNSTILKLPDVYGPNDERKKIFNIIQQFSEDKSSLEMSKGEQIIDILNIKDVINGLNHIIQNINEDPNLLGYKEYCLTNPTKYTLKELVSIFLEYKKINIDINWGKKPYRPREIFSAITNITPLPGWEKIYDIFE